MKLGRAVGWGIVIYAVMQLAWSGLALYGFAGTVYARGVELLVLIIVTAIAGRALEYSEWYDIIPYSLSWAIIVALLDAVYTVPFTGWLMYADWNVWVGYALVVIVPVLLSPLSRAVRRAE